MLSIFLYSVQLFQKYSNLSSTVQIYLYIILINIKNTYLRIADRKSSLLRTIHYIRLH